MQDQEVCAKGARSVLIEGNLNAAYTTVVLCAYVLIESTQRTSQSISPRGLRSPAIRSLRSEADADQDRHPELVEPLILGDLSVLCGSIRLGDLCGLLAPAGAGGAAFARAVAIDLVAIGAGVVERFGHLVQRVHAP